MKKWKYREIRETRALQIVFLKAFGMFWISRRDFILKNRHIRKTFKPTAVYACMEFTAIK